MSARLDRASSFLQRASTLASTAPGTLATAARAAGASFVGLSRDVGAPPAGGESSVSFFRPGGGPDSFVNVNPGGYEEGFFPESSRRSLDGSRQGFEQRPLSGTTILGSASGSPSLFEDGRFLSPLSFQGVRPSKDQARGRDRTTISLEGMPPEPVRTNRPDPKLFQILRCDTSGPQSFCGGIIANGGRFCTKLECSYASHRNKAWDKHKFEAGFYIHDLHAQRAYLEPFLPLADGVLSPSGRTMLSDGSTQSLEAWAAIFRHLQDACRAREEDDAAGLVEDEDFEEAANAGLQRFATAMKTQGGRERLNPLMSPKRLRVGELEDDDGGSISSDNLPQGPRVTALKHALALIKGELGSKPPDATYNTLHGGIQGLWQSMGTLEEASTQQLERLGTHQAKLDGLFVDSRATWNKCDAAARAVEQLTNLSGSSKVTLLESQLASMTSKVVELEATLDKATSFMMDLSSFVVTNLPQAAGPQQGSSVSREEFLSFTESHAQSLASIRQDMKGGTVTVGGFTFEGEESCVAFARAHMTSEPTYHCIPSLMYAMCMPYDEVVFKSDMQVEEIHMARTSRNPMQSAVILSVNTTIPAILEGPKDGIREGKHDFNAMKTYEEWMPPGMNGGTYKNLHDGIGRAFDRIKGAINLNLGSPTAKAVMMELHGEFLNHFRSIFTTMVGNYYMEILGKTGGPPPHDKALMASCWALVTKLLKTIFKEIHKVRMFAAVLGDLKEEAARVNGLYLYAALEELRVLRDFHEHDYRKHPKYNQQVVLHLFDTSLPRDVWEKATNGPGRDGLRFVRIDNSLTDLRSSVEDHRSSIDRLETAVGSIRSHLQLPAQGARNRRRGAGGGAGRGGGAGVMFEENGTAVLP